MWPHSKLLSHYRIPFRLSYLGSKIDHRKDIFVNVNPQFLQAHAMHIDRHVRRSTAGGIYFCQLKLKLKFIFNILQIHFLLSLYWVGSPQFCSSSLPIQSEVPSHTLSRGTQCPSAHFTYSGGQEIFPVGKQIIKIIIMLYSNSFWNISLKFAQLSTSLFEICQWIKKKEDDMSTSKTLKCK